MGSSRCEANFQFVMAHAWGTLPRFLGTTEWVGEPPGAPPVED